MAQNNNIEIFQTTKEDDSNLQVQIENMIEQIRNNGGWGSITLTYKGGDLNEIGLNLTLKPKKSGS